MNSFPRHGSPHTNLHQRTTIFSRPWAPTPCSQRTTARPPTQGMFPRETQVGRVEYKCASTRVGSVRYGKPPMRRRRRVPGPLVDQPRSPHTRQNPSNHPFVDFVSLFLLDVCSNDPRVLALAKAASRSPMVWLRREYPSWGSAYGNYSRWEGVCIEAVGA